MEKINPPSNPTFAGKMYILILGLLFFTIGFYLATSKVLEKRRTSPRFRKLTNWISPLVFGVWLLASRTIILDMFGSIAIGLTLAVVLAVVGTIAVLDILCKYYKD